MEEMASRPRGPCPNGITGPALGHAHPLSEVARFTGAPWALSNVHATVQPVTRKLHTSNPGLDALPPGVLWVLDALLRTLPCRLMAARRGAVRVEAPTWRVALRWVLEGALVEVAMRPVVINTAGIGPGWLRRVQPVRGGAERAHRRGQVPRRRAPAAVLAALSTPVRCNTAAAR